MEGCAGRQSVSRLVVPRKANGLRENMNKNSDGKNVPFCSRIGCSAKVTSTKVPQRTISSSSNGKEVVGGSSRTPGEFGCIRKPASARRQPSSNLDKDSSETSSSHPDDHSSSKPTLPRQRNKRGATNALSQSTISGKAVMTKALSSSRGVSQSSHHKSELGTRDALASPSVSSSLGNNEHTVGGGLSRNRLRNLRCTSASDVLQTNSRSATKITLTKKKNTDGESSSASNGNKASVLLPQGRNRSSLHGNGITVSDNRRSIVPTIRGNSVVSSSGKRSGYSSRSGRLGALASSSTSQQTPYAATPTDPSPSLSFSPSNSYSRPSSRRGRLHNTSPGSPSEAEPPRSLLNSDGLSRYNMNGLAEVLLALQRIEHDEALVYDQLASLETNLFSNGMFRFYDQHRDMRLDIDNMSYEELLALGDKMGTVSTALSEEALSRRLKKSIYQQTDESETSANSLNKDHDDIKCSICQEEYVDGDEVGNMACQHKYHVSCVEQWLRMKNWCPICKTSAEEETPL